MGKKPKIKPFYLFRKKDISGISGTGIIAHGVEFPTGTVVLEWATQYRSVEIHPSMTQLMSVHGHSGCTIAKYIK